MGASTILSPLNVLAAETVTYPSPDKVIPPEWSMGDCRFTATGAEGPYYLDDVDSGRDIRASQEGQDLLLNLNYLTLGDVFPSLTQRYRFGSVMPLVFTVVIPMSIPID